MKKLYPYRTVILFVSGIALSIIFLFYSFLVDKNLFKQLDFDTTVRVQNNIPRRVDDFFSFFSDIGSFEVLLILLLILLLVKRKGIAGFITLGLFGMFHIIEIFGKSVVENLPPPQFMLRTKHHIEFPQFHVRSEYSYPSGHSGRTLFLSVLFIVFIWQMKQWPVELRAILIVGILFFDTIMLVSRVYLGEHWMTDIIGGALLGAGLALIGSSIYCFFDDRNKKPIKKSLIH